MFEKKLLYSLVYNIYLIILVIVSYNFNVVIFEINLNWLVYLIYRLVKKLFKKLVYCLVGVVYILK